jgi:hypothetical protein
VNQILLELHAMRLRLLSHWWGTTPSMTPSSEVIVTDSKDVFPWE